MISYLEMYNIDHHHHLHHHHHHHYHHNHQKLQGRRNYGICTLLSTASILVLLCIAPKLTAAQSLSSVAQKLKVADVLQITSSTSLIKIELNGNAIKPGDGIPAKNFKNIDFKKVSWDHDEGSRYTLMLVDLDRKYNANATAIYNQYTNLNILGSNVDSGQVIVPFEPPNIPCQPSAKHRLAMLVFHQDQAIDLVDIAYIAASAGHPERREMSKFDDFVGRHRFHLAAANVFQVIGEVNGVCSAATTVYPNILSLLSIIVVMVMFQMVLVRQH